MNAALKTAPVVVVLSRRGQAAMPFLGELLGKDESLGMEAIYFQVE